MFLYIWLWLSFIRGYNMVSTKVFSLISKELGLSVELLGKAAKKLPRGAASFDKAVVGITEAGKAFETEILTFKNANGELLKKTINKVNKADNTCSLFTERHYQKIGKGRFIHTNNFEDGALKSTKQETLALKKYKNANVVTKTKVEKFLNNGFDTLEEHSIREFVDKGRRGSELALCFSRNKEGFISSKIHADSNLCKELDLKDEFLPIYLNTNKSDVAKDLTQIYAKRYGFEEIPIVKTFQETFNKNGERINGHFKSWDFTDDLKITTPEISFNTKATKLEMVSTAAHENWHMKQFRQTFDRNDTDIAEYSIDAKAKNWWGNAITNNQTAKAESKQAEKVEAIKNGFLESFTTGSALESNSYEKYRENILEKEAFKKGNKAKKYYFNKLRRPDQGLTTIFKDADWNRLHA